MAKVDEWLIGQVSLDEPRLLGTRLNTLLERGRHSVCETPEQVRRIARNYRGTYRSGADFDSIFFDVMYDRYPPLRSVLEPNPPFRRPFLSFSTPRSTELLLSFPAELLRQIFEDGASSLIPKPGAPLEDVLAFNTHRNKYLTSASLVTTTWRIQAQLELLSYAVCRSIKALDHLVAMLEETGRISSLRRLVCSVEGSASEQSEHSVQGGHGSDSSAMPTHPIHRLLALGPVLDELEIFGGSAVFTDDISSSLRKISTGILKITRRTTLSPINGDTKGTLVLNRVTNSLNFRQAESGLTSGLESLAIMNSDCIRLDQLTLTVTGVHPYRTNRIPPPVRPMLPTVSRTVPTFQNLKTLSTDGCPLGIRLLQRCKFPAVTTFELIPYQKIYDENFITFQELTLLALSRIPTLKTLILPLDLFRKAGEVLGLKIKGIRIVLATPNKWNWLEYTGGDVVEPEF